MFIIVVFFNVVDGNFIFGIVFFLMFLGVMILDVDFEGVIDWKV